jgi:hypothetical protein
MGDYGSWAHSIGFPIPARAVCLRLRLWPNLRKRVPQPSKRDRNNTIFSELLSLGPYGAGATGRRVGIGIGPAMPCSASRTPEPSVFLFQLAALTVEDIEFGAVHVFAFHQSAIRQKTIALLTTRNSSGVMYFSWRRAPHFLITRARSRHQPQPRESSATELILMERDRLSLSCTNSPMMGGAAF